MLEAATWAAAAGDGGRGVKRGLTSNIKVSGSRVASPGAVDCHTLVLALVRLLAVLNLKRSWGGRAEGQSSGPERAHAHRWWWSDENHTPTYWIP